MSPSYTPPQGGGLSSRYSRGSGPWTPSQTTATGYKLPGSLGRNPLKTRSGKATSRGEAQGPSLPRLNYYG